MATSTIYKTEYIYTPPVKDCVLDNLGLYRVYTFNISSGSRNLVMFSAGGNSRTWIGHVYSQTSGGAVSVVAIHAGSNVTVATDANELKFTLDATATLPAILRVVNEYGDIPTYS